MLAKAYGPHRVEGDEFCALVLAAGVPALETLISEARWQHFRALCDVPPDFLGHVRQNVDHQGLRENMAAVLARFVHNPADLARVVTCVRSASSTHKDEIGSLLRALRQFSHPDIATLAASVEDAMHRRIRARILRRVALAVGIASLLLVL
jgi:hypothetical protein